VNVLTIPYLKSIPDRYTAATSVVRVAIASDALNNDLIAVNNYRLAIAVHGFLVVVCIPYNLLNHFSNPLIVST
jgi:hypothetical protein